MLFRLMKQADLLAAVTSWSEDLTVVKLFLDALIISQQVISLDQLETSNFVTNRSGSQRIFK